MRSNSSSRNSGSRSSCSSSNISSSSRMWIRSNSRSRSSGNRRSRGSSSSRSSTRFTMSVLKYFVSQFGGLEALVTALCDQFPKLRAKRPLVLAVQLSVCFLIGLTTVTYVSAQLSHSLVHSLAGAIVGQWCKRRTDET